MAVPFTFRSVIYLELISGYGVWWESCRVFPYGCPCPIITNGQNCLSCSVVPRFEVGQPVSAPWCFRILALVFK